MSSWFSGPPRVVPHRWAGGAAMMEPDHRTVLSWPVGGAPAPDDVMVLGPRTRARYWHDVRATAGCMRLPIAPGRASALLGRSARDVADLAVPLNDFDLDFERLFGDVAPAPDGMSRLLGAAAELFGRARPEPVHRAARRLHVSERHLRGLFTHAVGLPPRLYTQIRRVRVVLDNSGVPLPEVATLAGYYGRLVGAPPAAFRAGRWPAPERCGARPASGTTVGGTTVGGTTAGITVGITVGGTAAGAWRTPGKPDPAR